MENEAYQEYFSRKRNKVSLAMWVLINNNVVSTNAFLLIIAFEVFVNVTNILFLYQHVNCIPPLSEALGKAVSYNDPLVFAYVVIGIFTILFITMTFIMIMILKDFSWQVYQEKRIIYQVMSLLVVLFRQPLIGLSFQFIYDNLRTFSELEQGYLKFISVICSILSLIILFIYSYMGSFLFNLTVPNDILPWSGTSHKPYLAQVLWKFLLLLTMKFKGFQGSIALLYSLELMMTLTNIYRVYQIVLKSQGFDSTIGKFGLMADVATIHIQVFFLFTIVSQNHQNYFFFVLAFLPVSCLCAHYLNKYCNRKLLMKIVNDQLESENDRLMSFIYIMGLYSHDSDSSWKELIWAQQIHFVKCEDYIKVLEKQMRKTLLEKNREILEQQGLNARGTSGGFLYDSDNEGNTNRFSDRTRNDMIGQTVSAQMTTPSGLTLHPGKRKDSDYPKKKQSQSTLGGAMNNLNINGGAFDNKRQEDTKNKGGEHTHEKKQEDEKIELDVLKIEFDDQITGPNSANNLDKKDSDVILGITQQQDIAPQKLGTFGKTNNPRSSTLKKQVTQQHPTRKQSFKKKEEASEFQFNGDDIYSKNDGDSLSRAESSMLMKAKRKQAQLDGKGEVNFSKTKSSQSKHFNKKSDKRSYYNTVGEIFNGVGKQQFGTTSAANNFLMRKSNSLGFKNSNSIVMHAPFDYEEKKESLRKLVRHFFGKHLLEDSETCYQLRLIKIFFTLKIMNNPYLAHFLLFNFQDGLKKESNFIEANCRLINQRYIEELINSKQQQDEEDTKILQGQLDLQGMLNVNQLIVEFDKSLEQLTEEILDFWEDLMSQRNTVKLFEKGIRIAKQLKSIQILIDLIQAKQCDNEHKIYLQMAQFYSQVVFKSSEGQMMTEKARVALQTKTVNKLSYQRVIGTTMNQMGGAEGEDQEKCLVMASLNLKKPMRITFMNKSASKLTQYSMTEALQLTINSLMPSFIAEIHSKFIDEFLRTGKNRMIKIQRELFVKQKRGTVVPVLTYLFVNNISRKHMILMFEKNRTFSGFDEANSDLPTTFFLADEQFRIGEISDSFHKVTGFSYKAFESLEQEKDRPVNCDDIIKIRTFQCEVSNLLKNYDQNEVDVIFKNIQDHQEIVKLNNMETSSLEEVSDPSAKQGSTLNNYVSPQPSDQNVFAIQTFDNYNPFMIGEEVKIEVSIDKVEPSPKQVNKLVKGKSGKQNEGGDIFSMFVCQDLKIPDIYIMKIVNLNFLGGKYKFNLIAFKRKPFTSHQKQKKIMNAFGNEPLLIMKSVHENSKGRQDAPINQMNTDRSQISKSGIAIEIDSTPKTGNQRGNNNQSEYTSLDIMSQSSSSSLSSLSSTTAAIFSTYSQQTNSNTTPKTLKFILNLSLAIAFVMITASSAILSFSLGNLSNSLLSLVLCKNAFKTIDEVTSIRLLVRSVINIYQGYEANTNQYVKDRASLFEGLIDNLKEDMRGDANKVVQMAEAVDRGKFEIHDIDCWFLSASGFVYMMEQTLQQGVFLLSNKLNDFIASTDKRSILGRSQLSQFNLTSALMNQQPRNNTFVSTVERDVFYIINNTNGQFYDVLTGFSPMFSQYQVELIDTQRIYLTAVSMGVMSMVLLSSLIVIPLFGRIQTRILELMKLFFNVDPLLKLSIINRIRNFQDQFLKQQNGDQNHQKLKIKMNDIEVLNQTSTIQDFKAEKKVHKHKHKKSNNQNLYSIKIESPIADPKKQKSKLNQAFGLKNQLNLGKSDDLHQQLDFTEEFKTSDQDQKQKNKKGSNSNKRAQKKNKSQLVTTLGMSIKDDKTPKSSSKYNRDDEVNKQGEVKNNQSSSEDEEKSKEQKKGSKQEKRGSQGVSSSQEDQMNSNNQDSARKDVINEFSKYTNRRKIVQALLIMALLMFMASFFLIKYLLSVRMQSLMGSSLADLKTVFGRLSCAQNVINQFSESYFENDIFNTQKQIQDAKDLDSKINFCMILERDFSKTIMGSPHDYLLDSRSLILAVEQGDLCRNTTLPKEYCLELSDQIKKQGLQTYFFDIMKSIKQMELDLQTVLRNRRFNASFAAQQLRTKIAPFVDTLILTVYPMQKEVQEATFQGVYQYFASQSTIFSIVYGCYMAATVLFIIFFITTMYQNLRREMLLSNRLLYIIDFESLKDVERAVLLKFLSTY